MKVQLVWFSGLSAEDILSNAEHGYNFNVLPNLSHGVDVVAEKDVYPGVKSHALTFECEGLARGSEIARRMEVELIRRYEVQPTILIDKVGTLEYAAKCDERVRTLEAATQKAVDQLRATRSWFKDRRIGEIRRDLERAL